jgi:hypothetical protein
MNGYIHGTWASRAQTAGHWKWMNGYIHGTSASRAQTAADFLCIFTTRLPNIACGGELRFKIGS